MNQIDFSKRFTKERLDEFSGFLNNLSDQIGFKVSSRGWGYLLEQQGLITKDQFDKVENLINRCRKEGLLPVDFTAEESARSFKEIHRPSTETYDEHIESWLRAALTCESYYEPDWWVGEKYYIQILVEKVDLVTLFQPLCESYHIPIGNAKGWSSILQRADYARRFKKAEDLGLMPVLLYCGDHDPDGLRISDTIRKNLEDVEDVHWDDGTDGYDPTDLIIDRFGLNYDFIIDNKLTWIDNLITGSGKNLANPAHPNFNMPYLQHYLSEVGERKCEANAVVAQPKSGRDLCEAAILKYLGDDALDRFAEKRSKVIADISDRMDELNVLEPIQEAIDNLKRGNDEE